MSKRSWCKFYSKAQSPTCPHTVMACLDTVCRPHETTDHSLRTATSLGSTCNSTRKHKDILNTRMNECVQHLSSDKSAFMHNLGRLRSWRAQLPDTSRFINWNASSGVNSHRVQPLIRVMVAEGFVLYCFKMPGEWGLPADITQISFHESQNKVEKKKKSC